MATVKKGMLTKSGEWWKHLRETKRVFWKGERQAVQKLIRTEVESGTGDGNSSQGDTVPVDD